MKKETASKLFLSLIVTSFLISILSIGVFAADPDPTAIKDATKTAWMASFAVIMGPIEAILEIIFGPQWLNATRFFFFVLLTLIMWTITPLIFGEERPVLNRWIGLVISILAISAIPPALLDTLITNYGAMGAAFLTLIPFIIVLVFSVRIDNALLARMIWILYCVYYFALYTYKIVTAATSGSGDAGQYTLYGFAILGGILMFFFIGAIRNIMFKGKMDAINETGTQIAKRGKLLHKMQKKELEESYGSGI